MNEFKNAYYFRSFAGLIGVVGLVLVCFYWPAFSSLSSLGLYGACCGIAIICTIVSSGIYSYSGHWWYLSFTSLLFLLTLYLAEPVFRPSGQAQFCQDFAKECLLGVPKGSFCTDQSQVARFEKMCGNLQ